ncbi:MAG: gliding motility lipoprotein GldH [Paludibacteraceae bacterium]|nr:gliding motility lipoprotein GldH [Paludibacteraceae bacterium]
MKSIRFLYLLAFIAIFFTSCNNNCVYNDCSDIDGFAWHKDSCVLFSPVVNDTVNKYNVLITVRHDTEYEYQNLWLFVKSASPDGIAVQDTVECYLADNRGKFLGDGVSVYEMPILYMRKIKFPKQGTYKFEIQQGMRDTILAGVRNICLSIEKYSD